MARDPATLEELREQVLTLSKKVDQIAAALAMLTRALLDTTTPTGRPRVKLTKAQAAEDNKRRTYKARVARAAKRYGFTVEEWVERFGDVDRLPPGQRPPRRTLPQ